MRLREIEQLLTTASLEGENYVVISQGGVMKKVTYATLCTFCEDVNTSSLIPILGTAEVVTIAATAGLLVIQLVGVSSINITASAKLNFQSLAGTASISVTAASVPFQTLRQVGGSSDIALTGSCSLGFVRFSMKFDGNQYLTVPGFVMSDEVGAGDFTISCWFKEAAQTLDSNYDAIFGFGFEEDPSEGTLSVDDRLYIRRLNTNLQLIIEEVDEASYTSNSCAMPTPVVWHHLAFTREGDTIEIFIDGDSEIVLTSGHCEIDFIDETNKSLLWIGGFRPDHSQYGASTQWHGHIDDFAIWDEVLSDEAIDEISSSGNMNLTVAGTEYTSDMKDALIGYWRMNEGTGTTVADSSGKGHPAEMGARLAFDDPTWSTDVWPSYSRLALTFDGTDDSISIPQSDDLEPTNPTFSAWVYPTGDTDVDGYGQYFMTKGYKASPPYASLILRYSNAVTGGERFGVFVGYTDDTFTQLWTTSGTFPKDNWYHVAATYDGTAVKLYVNGDLEATATVSKTIEYDGLGDEELSLGEISGGDSRSFAGVMDDVAVFDSALSLAEIELIYNDGTPADLSALNPVGWWRMGDGEGDTESGGGSPSNGDAVGTIVDQGSGGNDATQSTTSEKPTFSDTPDRLSG